LNKYNTLREKAVNLRKSGHTLNEIIERLGVPKTTAYYWIKDVEIRRQRAFVAHTKSNRARSASKATQAVKRKYENIHKQHAEEAKRQWHEGLGSEPHFRCFLMLYMTEGSKRGQNVRITNTNPHLIKYGYEWLKVLNYRNKNIFLEVSIYPNHDRDAVENYWRELLGVEDIRIYYGSEQRGKLKQRNWAIRYGTARICVVDAYLKTRIDTWIELFTEHVLNNESVS
jgi:hypothetical protein